jgi:hypothetical protein
MADWQFEADEGRGGEGAEWMQDTVADWWGHGFMFYSPAVKFISNQMVTSIANDSFFKVSTAIGSISFLL